MIAEETINHTKAGRRPVRRECSTCSNMPSCWYKDQDGFKFDAVKDCWEPKSVPAYVNNTTIK